MPQMVNDKNELEAIKKQLNYIELKLNLLMKETLSKTEVKWNDEKQEQEPKTVLEVWESSSKNIKDKENQY